MIRIPNFKTRQELEEYLKKLWLVTTLEDLVLNKNVLNKKGSFLKCINLIKKGKKTKLLVLENNETVAFSSAKAKIIDFLTNTEVIIKLESLWNKKYYCSEKMFKSIYYKTEEYRNKINNTCKKKYGKTACENMREKGAETMLKKYGVKSFLTRGEHYDKSIKTVMIEKYGAAVPLKSEVLKNKISKTINERYGVDWFLKRGNHYKKITDIMIQKYGVENAFYITNQIKTNNVSKYEKEILNEIAERFNLTDSFYFKTKQKVIHYEQNNKKKWYSLDFYNEEQNLVIEVFGDYWHANPKFFSEDFIIPKIKICAKDIWEKDLKKKIMTINELNCNYIVIWCSDWKKDKELILTLIEYAIKHKKNN